MHTRPVDMLATSRS